MRTHVTNNDNIIKQAQTHAQAESLIITHTHTTLGGLREASPCFKCEPIYVIFRTFSNGVFSRHRKPGNQIDIRSGASALLLLLLLLLLMLPAAASSS